MGATLGDSVVSQANREVRSSLRGDLLDALADARSATPGSPSATASTPPIPLHRGDRLRGRTWRSCPRGRFRRRSRTPRRNAVKDAGGTVDSVSAVRRAPRTRRSGNSLGGGFRLPARPHAAAALGRRLGRELARGGRVPRKLEDSFPDDFKGDFRGADAVVFYRTDDERDKRRRRSSPRDRGVCARAACRRGGRAQAPRIRRKFRTTSTQALVGGRPRHPAGTDRAGADAHRSQGNFGFKGTAEAPCRRPVEPGRTASAGAPSIRPRR